MCFPAIFSVGCSAFRVADGHSAVGQLRRVPPVTPQGATQRLAAEGSVVVAAVAPTQNVHGFTATELHISTMQRLIHVVVVPQGAQKVCDSSQQLRHCCMRTSSESMFQNQEDYGSKPNQIGTYFPFPNLTRLLMEQNLLRLQPSKSHDSNMGYPAIQIK